jgi:photosystem II stability/assembly factor-like uncharacterized protein
LATDNRGQSWHALRPPVATASWIDSATGYLHGVSEVLFANDRDGWVYGQGIWSTHDGGVTWHEDTINTVDDIVLEGGKVWALEYRSCPYFANCVMTLWSAHVGQHDWHRSDPLPLRIQPGLADLSIVNDRAFVAAAQMPPHRPSPYHYQSVALFTLPRNGNRWKSLSAPCNQLSVPGGDGFEAGLLAQSNSLWMVCGGEPMSGLEPHPRQEKSLYTSGDFGSHWRLVAFTDGYQEDCKKIKAGWFPNQTPPIPKSAVCTMPGRGSLGSGSFAMSGASRMWLRLGGWGVWSTGDAGRSWHVSLPYKYEPAGFPTYSTTVFTNSAYGWTTGLRHRSLLRTTDGGKHWTQVILAKKLLMARPLNLYAGAKFPGRCIQ